MSETGPNSVVAAGRPNLAKKPRMSRKLYHALDMYISGSAKTQQEAADKAGLSREHFCRALKLPHVQAFIVRRTGELLAGLLPKVYRALDMVLDGDNKAAALQGAVTLFRQYGLITADAPTVSVTMQAPGYVIDLSGGHGSPARVIEGELVTPGDAAQDDEGGE